MFWNLRKCKIGWQSREWGMMLATRKVPGLVEKQIEHERRPQDNLYHGDSSGHGNVVIHSFA